MKSTMERIQSMKQKVAVDEKEMLELATKLNSQRALYHRLLGMHNAQQNGENNESIEEEDDA